MVITHPQFSVVTYGSTRKGMTRNDLHYLAAATMLEARWLEAVTAPSSCASFQYSGLEMTCPPAEIADPRHSVGRQRNRRPFSCGGHIFCSSTYYVPTAL